MVVRSLAWLLALTCLGSGAALLGGRQLLQQRPLPDPGTPLGTLKLLQRFDPDPVRRREAALLSLADLDRPPGGGDPVRAGQLLRNQAWGRDPLAAVVLKRDAQAAAQRGDRQGSERRWRQLLNRFPGSPASADALYALGRQQPELRSQLLQRFPAHPAALAAAVEAGGEGALHLARWGVRWPGAKAVLEARCNPAERPGNAGERNLLARGLAQLGDSKAALTCLDAMPPSPSTQLAIARSLGRGGDSGLQAEARMLSLAQTWPSSPEAAEAARWLADSDTPSSLAALGELPAALQDSAAVQARRALVLGQPSAALRVMRRWKDDPASWELQWQLARQALLSQDWRGASTLLGTSALDGVTLPGPLEARRRFWLSLSQWQLGKLAQAKAGWAELLATHPGGYYGWRAAVRLGRDDIDLDPDTAPGLAPPPWHPLDSGRQDLDRLWRLGQTLEAWEQWRHLRGEAASPDPAQLLVEGRLRRGVGDHWMGLAQLEQASLRLPAGQCPQSLTLERSLAEPAFTDELNQAARDARLPATLLAAVAKQESRFSAAVRSPVGATGLLQLMPETAAELAGTPLPVDALTDPQRNASLGARYLRQLLDRWEGNPLLMTASYNAGAGAVEGWISPLLPVIPELWVEAIPYPETRLYVKKVLGNLWSFQEPRLPLCR